VFLFFTGNEKDLSK